MIGNDSAPRKTVGYLYKPISSNVPSDIGLGATHLAARLTHDIVIIYWCFGWH